MVGRPAIQNEKSVVKNLRNSESKCLPPMLSGDHEHSELLEIKEGPGGALGVDGHESDDGEEESARKPGQGGRKRLCGRLPSASASSAQQG